MTAVEWFEMRLKETYNREGKLPIAYTLSLVNQAKAMERQQIEEAYNEDLYGGLSGRQKFIDGSDYFTQTYQQ